MVSLLAALRYAALGWPVFPTKAGAKEPATTHGCLDATTDVATIRRWWKQMPAANVAIGTGAPGVDVVDVDIKGVNGYEALARLRRAGLLAGPLAMVRTPSGGLHLYYRGTEQGNGSLARHGVDFRGKGGYVVAPPSVVGGKPYELVEQRCDGRTVDFAAVRRFLDPPRPPWSLPRSGPIATSLDTLARWVEQQHEPGRNNALYWAACRALQTGHDDLSPLVAAAVSTGLDETAARKTAESARNRNLSKDKGVRA